MRADLIAGKSHEFITLHSVLQKGGDDAKHITRNVIVVEMDDARHSIVVFAHRLEDLQE